MFSIFYPVYAEELNQTTAWDAGYIKAEVILPTTIAINDTIGRYGGSCVSFVKNSIGVSTSWYTPQYVWDHADLLSLKPLPSPIPGAIIITNEGPVWHMGIIESVEYEPKYGIIKIDIVESNYAVHNLINRRTLTLDDPNIVGFLNMVL